MNPRRFILAASFVALAAVGCATQSPAQRAGEDGGATDAETAREDARVTLTLPPFYGYSEYDERWRNEDRWPLDNVKVCVVRRGPYGGAWKDFEEIKGLCELTDADAKVVIRGVPALAELVVTAEKDRYRPSVFAVTTTSSDTDMARSESSFDMVLREERPELGQVPPEVPVDLEFGNLDFTLIAISANFGWTGLAGAKVALVDESGHELPAGVAGPFFWADGISRPEATRSINEGVHAPYVGASFVNIPEDGLYRVRVDHPGATCRTAVGIFGEAYYGWAGRLNEVRAPVLKGHLTPSLRAGCLCNDELDAPGTADAAFLGTCGADASVGAVP